MKIKILSLIFAIFSFSFTFQQNTELYSVWRFSENREIKINNKLAFVGQTFKSFNDVQFSDCQDEFLIAMTIKRRSGVIMKGKCQKEKIIPYIFRQYFDVQPFSLVIAGKKAQASTIAVGSFNDQINVSKRVEELITKGFEFSITPIENRTNIGIPFQYSTPFELDSMLNVVRKSFKDAYVVKDKK